MHSSGSKVLKDFLIYAVLCLSSFLMARSIVRYAELDPTVGFLAFKQDYIGIRIWRIAFYVHVFTSLVVLIAGIFQFSDFILLNFRKLHRSIGKLYVGLILFVNFPAALVMAIYANGGYSSKAAFLILDFLWFGFTLKALLEIKQKNVVAHRRYMIRSYALSFSAITFRVWKIVLLNLVSIDPQKLYMIQAWLGFIPNMLVAEWALRRVRSD